VDAETHRQPAEDGDDERGEDDPPPPAISDRVPQPGEQSPTDGNADHWTQLLRKRAPRIAERHEQHRENDAEQVLLVVHLDKHNPGHAQQPEQLERPGRIETFRLSANTSLSRVMGASPVGQACRGWLRVRMIP
jgi:hypothetical protein